MKVWWVYLLLCEGNSLYCGIAKDPNRRLLAHVRGKGARYTRIHRALAIVHREGPYSHGDALRRERQIKSLPKAEKSRLIDDPSSSPSQSKS